MDAVRLSGIRSREVVPVTMDDGYDLLEVLIRRGTTINGAIVALRPAEDGTVVADVCIDGPPVP
jgi:hypothetical protein